MKHNKLLNIAAFGVPALALVTLGASVAYAAETSPAKNPISTHMTHRTLTDAQKIAIKQAKTLRKAGKTAEAAILLKQAGLSGFGNNHREGVFSMRMNRNRHQGHEGRDGVFRNIPAHTAIEANDFVAWKTAMKDFPNQAVLTQDLFDKMVKVETLQHEIHTTLGQK